MIVLVVLGIALIAGAVWFLARPLSKQTPVAGEEESHQLGQVRERLLAQLAELDAESTDKTMDETVAGDERLRLEAELAEVLRRRETLRAPKEQASEAVSRPLWAMTVLILALVLPTLTGSLYLLHGQAVTTEQLAQARPGQGGQGQDGQGGQPPQVMEMIARLEQRLAEHPEDPAGWAQLGRSYQVLGRPADAMQAYDKAHELAPENAEILRAYATFMFQLHQGVTEGKVLELFTRLHELEPTYPGALWFLGLAAYNKQDFKQAISYWEATLKYMSPDSQGVPQVKAAIEQARARL